MLAKEQHLNLLTKTLYRSENKSKPIALQLNSSKSIVVETVVL